MKKVTKKDVKKIPNAFGVTLKGRDGNNLADAINSNADVLSAVLERLERLEKGKGE